VLAIVGSNIALVLIILGSTVAMWIHISSQIQVIQKEMKDFHGRLERQDAEFKSHLLHAHDKAK